MTADAIQALIAAEPAPNPPEGFAPIKDRGGFDMLMGPLFAKVEDGKLVMGFRCTRRHLNGHGSCHGGMIASFADMAAYAVRVQGDLLDTATPTVSLTTEFLRPVSEGDWVEVRTSLNKRGRSLQFAQMVGTVGDRAAFQANAVFTMGPPDPGGYDALAQIDGIK